MLDLILIDFKERVRRPGFLITLAITAYAGYLFVPEPDAGYATLRMGGTTGLPNSAFVGALVCILTNTFLSLIGFYLVRGTFTRDERLEVGPLLAATSVSKMTIIFSRISSGFLYLMSMTGLLVIMALIMVIVRDAGEPIDLWALVAPFLFLSVPCMAVTASFAVLFDSIRIFRGAWGNVTWYFLWTALLIIGIQTGEMEKGNLHPSSLDLAGSTVLLSSMTEQVKILEPDFTNSYNIGIHLKEEEGELKFIHWTGVAWNSDLIVPRFSWLMVAISLGLFSMIFFDRFDPAKRRMRMSRSKKKEKVETVSKADSYATTYTLRPALPGKPRLLGVLYGEFLLMVKGVNIWWYIALAGLNIACIFAPMTVVKQFLLPIAWIWPLSLWSALGTREHQHGMEDVVGSFPSPLKQQLPALWLAGAALGILASVGFILRGVVTGDLVTVSSLIIPCMFVPALALLCGTTSGTPRLFEVVYLLLWYMGPVNGLPGLDYLGMVAERPPIVPIALAVLIVAAIPVILTARARQLRV